MKRYIIISPLFFLSINTVHTQFQTSQLVTNILVPQESAFLIYSSGIPEISFENEEALMKIEAESTRSDMGEWIVVKKGDKNYVENASGGACIEFTGNNPGNGDPSSPIAYTFEVPVNGSYRLLMMTSKRLEGARGDMCNDAWVKMSGNFESATNLSREQLTNYLKFFQGGAEKTPENAWHWAIRGATDDHVMYNMTYEFKKGEKYTLTIAGRSQRFSIDYIVFFDESKFTLAEAQEKARNRK
jgi:hypothetical protein